MTYYEPHDANPYAPPKPDLILDDLDVPQTIYLGYAGFWRRAVAFWIDHFVIYLVAGVGSLVLWGLIAFALTGGSDDDPTDTVAIVIGLGFYATTMLAYALYFILMESSASQATLGKMAMGVRVVDLYGQRIGIGRATGRFMAKFLSSFFYIGFIMAGLTEKKQGLHDLVASTLVVRTR